VDNERQLAGLALALQHLLLASFGMRPEDLGRETADAAKHLGGEDLVLLLCDYAQTTLVPFDEHDPREYAIDDSAAGQAFRTDTVVEETLDDARRRLWLPVKDSAERQGVMGVTDDGSITAENWLTVSSLVGELVVSKIAYGDHITMRKRSQPFSLTAERAWSLLPPLTFSSPDVTIAGFLQPPERIAGDAFDYGVTARVASIAIFDAMGHGLEASRMANLAVATYRNSRRNGVGLAESLRELDAQIASQFGDSRFVTGQLASLDLDSGRMDIVNAGHPRPLVLRPGQRVEEVACAPSAPAGIGCEPTVTAVDLRPGDSVLFRTDGVVDARSPSGEVFSDERLADLVHELNAAGLPPSEVVRKVVHAVVEHRASRPGDDAMVVLVRWKVREGPI
jgi:hypothetical protein